jgi:large subunit ribosomal protein L6
MGRPLNPLRRWAIREPLDVGIRSINSLLSVGRGQRLRRFLLHLSHDTRHECQLVLVEVAAGQVNVNRIDDSRESRALHGLSRTLVANMVKGVSDGFERKLELFGVGFRAEVKGKDAVNFSLGYSHPILFKLPAGVTAEWKEVKAGDKQGEVYIRGVDKDLLGRTAAEIRALRPPEPYKGKGIKYAEETIKRKQGKTGAA